MGTLWVDRDDLNDGSKELEDSALEVSLGSEGGYEIGY